MAKYRTALGKVVDMSILATRNEKTRAVGNMKVNARGDTIDSKGNIIKPATNKVNEAYNKTVGNRTAQPVKKQPRTGDQTARTHQRPRPGPAASGGVNQRIEEKEPVQLTPEELELERELDDDELTEQIKAMESGLTKAK
jgi:hypothetical protein